VRYAGEQGRPWGTPGAPTGIPTIRDGVAQKAWLCGPPSEIVAGLKAYEEAYPGLDQVLVHWAEGMPPAEFKEQLKTFAREVMPAFPGAQLTAASPTA
jgi:hypothetical protein